jgi:hypothetical protein
MTLWSLLCTASFLLAIILQQSIPLLSSSYPGRLASRTSTVHFSTEFLFITILQGPRTKHRLSIVGKACLQCRCIATEVTQLLLAYSLQREMCLLSRCLAINVYSEFTILVFRASCHSTSECHVIFYINNLLIISNWPSNFKLYTPSRKSAWKLFLSPQLRVE